MTIPPEILIPAIVSMVLAFVAHFVSIMMQGRSNKHDFSVKTVDTLEKELSRARESLSTERKENRILADSNTDLRGIRYRLEADLEIAKEQIVDLRKKNEDANSEIKDLKESLFQTNAEIAFLKQRVEELEANLSD